MQVELTLKEVRALANSAAETLDGCSINDKSYWPEDLSGALLSGADKLEEIYLTTPDEGGGTAMSEREVGYQAGPVYVLPAESSYAQFKEILDRDGVEYTERVEPEVRTHDSTPEAGYRGPARVITLEQGTARVGGYYGFFIEFVFPSRDGGLAGGGRV